MKIGIIAYGSVINEPGTELLELIKEKHIDILTPFNIEFARKSSKRANAPTLTVVKTGGSSVRGAIFILRDGLSQYKVADLLWRRETRKTETDEHYLAGGTVNSEIKIDTISSYLGFDALLYAAPLQNIPIPSASLLADLAINSAYNQDIAEMHKDGISYLVDIISLKIVTPLMAQYEEEILKRTDSIDLVQAYEKISGLQWSANSAKRSSSSKDQFRVRCYICGRRTSIVLFSKNDDGLPRACELCTFQNTPGNPNIRPKSRLEEIMDNPEEIE
jgi:hypothetical protein